VNEAAQAAGGSLRVPGSEHEYRYAAPL